VHSFNDAFVLVSECAFKEHISGKTNKLFVSNEKNFILHHKVDTVICSVHFYNNYIVSVTFIQHVLILYGIISINYVKNKKTPNYITVFDSLFNHHFTSLFQRLPFA